VAVTGHGQTVGYFIPTQSHLDADLAALKNVSKVLDGMLAAREVDVESIVADFKVARKNAASNKRPPSKS
jgi:hypothetical protein